MDPIIEAAKRLVERRGEQFTIDELAASAGVSRSTIYRRHGGRSGVIEKLGEHGVDITSDGGARERILDAMKELVGRQGRLDATVDEIADEAGVSSMTVFRHFGDKSTLLQEFFRAVTPRAVTIPTLAEDTANIDDVLERVAHATISFARSYPGLVQIAVGAHDEQEALLELRATRGSTREALIEFFAVKIRSGEIAAEEPAEPAAHFAAMILAEALVAPALGGGVDVEEAASRAVDRFLRAFGAGDE